MNPYADLHYMQRCINLALMGGALASPNPMVGAVLVHQNRIIGEGWHQKYGAAHAEVNCINSVNATDRKRIPESTLYVSLEPCAHYGKTPPCALLIIKHNIPRVVIGCADTFSEVSGKGIALLQNAGIKVTVGVLEQECRTLNRRFFTRQEKNRPYIILKWAQSLDGFIAPVKGHKVMLSNKMAQNYVQKMRSEEDAILVGYNTAITDNPYLTNRWGNKHEPIRVVIDPNLQLPHTLHLFDQSVPTIVLNYHKESTSGKIQLRTIPSKPLSASAILSALPKLNSIIVEGGTQTLNLFLQENLWDEAIVIETPVQLKNGVKAPNFGDAIPNETLVLDNNMLKKYKN